MMNLKTILIFIVLLTVLPIVYADVNVVCTPSSGTVSCDLQLSRSDSSPTLSSATFSISLSNTEVLSPSSNFVTNLPAGFTSLGSFANGLTISTTGFGSNPSSLGTLNFDIVGDGTTNVNLNFIAAEDDGLNNVLNQFSVVTQGAVTLGTIGPSGVTVICNPTNPSIGGTVSCDLRLLRSDANPTLSSATFSISLSNTRVLSPSSNFVTNLPAGFTSLGSFANGLTISTTGFGSNPTSLGTLNFNAVSGGSTNVNLNFIAAEDDGLNNVLNQFSTVTPAIITVPQSCNAVTPTCANPGVACPSGASLARLNCPSGQICANEVCVPVNTCTEVRATACTTGISCPGNVVASALGCPSGETCNANNNCVDQPSEPALCGCTVEGQTVATNCQAEQGFDIVNDRCTRLLQNIKNEIETGNNKLSVLARIAGFFRTLFDGLFS
jgi:hypothetical protein